MLSLQIALIIGLAIIFYQDYKERLVFWWLFPSIAVGLAGLHIIEVGMQQFIIHIAFTLGIIIILFTVLSLYIKWRLGIYDFRSVIGIGDILMLGALALGFPPVSFSTLLVFGLLFALILHQILIRVQASNLSTPQEQIEDVISQKRDQYGSIDLKNTVPLAGYLSLFFGGILLTHWTGFYPNLYLI